MENKEEKKKEGVKGCFLSELFKKLDDKLKKKAESGPCCCKPSDKKDGSCCS